MLNNKILDLDHKSILNIHSRDIFFRPSISFHDIPHAMTALVCSKTSENTLLSIP